MTPRSQFGLPKKQPRIGNNIKTVYSGMKTLDELKQKTALAEAKRANVPPPLARSLDLKYIL